MKKALLFLIALPFFSMAQSELVVPKKNAIAFVKETRQTNGNPGKNYWQNSADYNIKVIVNPVKKIISGQEKIVYSNNSPDSLKTIVIRLYQDLFKKGANRNSMVEVNPLDIHDGVNINSLAVNNKEFEQKRIKRQGTLMFIPLKEKLAPHSKIELDIAWDFRFPQHTLIRMGAIDSTSWFVAQWYPQVAVYDDVYGWDLHSYNGMAEFYNDFSNFEVEITVPKNFVVWATGEPVNLEEVLQPGIYERYKKTAISSDIIHVITREDLEKNNTRTGSNPNGVITTDVNTWKYRATNVADFAFGLSDHYLWDIASVEVDKATGRKTIVGAAYNQNAVHYDKVAEIARETVRFLSEEVPGVPYPFPYVTAFDGDFGMEYPMITNVGPDEDYGTTVYAQSHEIAHAYFPFLVGTNETKNGWLDEGLVVFMPEKIQSRLSPGYNVPKNNTAAFSAYAGMEDEVALITPTFYLDPKIYFYLNYAKTEQALRMLQMELGDDLFSKCLRIFIERWQYKHPTPIDFFNTFNDVASQDLTWFWQAWYYQAGGIPDLALTNVQHQGNKLNLVVRNNGDIPLPTVVSFFNNDKLLKTIIEPAGKWRNSPDGIKVSYESTEPVTQILLGSEIIPDANRKDNEVKF
ncbi:MAG TPA: M1 family metallopeptidase [Lentimicrobium sp.]|nr:M1 family metallopeptidase [Lentimicrobium sp.]